MSDIPDLVLPLELDPATGDLRQAEQGSDREIASCILAVLRMPLGHIPELPDFGSEDLTLTRHTVDVANLIRGAVAPWEPRANLVADDVIAGVVRTIRLSA